MIATRRAVLAGAGAGLIAGPLRAQDRNAMPLALNGAWRQGGYALGRTAPGALVFVDGEALTTAGYPAKADSALVNKPMVVLILFILGFYVTMVYGPIAAALVEMFPTNIRYTSMSLPYHIGNGWFGGFLPTTAFAIVAATGNIYSGLWYPIVVALGTVVLGFLLVKEGKDVDLNA